MNTPKIIVTRQWITAWVSEVMAHQKEETACALYGVLLNNGTLIINSLLKPSPKSLKRSTGEVHIGGEQLKQAYLWLAQNWDWMQKNTSPKVDGKFYFLDSVHSHYTLGTRVYSPTDKERLVEAINEGGLSIAVGVLATIEGKNSFTVAPETFRSGSLITDRKWNVRLQFYCLTREMVTMGKKEPLLVTPTIVDVKDTPATPPLGWQFTHEAWFDEQIRSLEHMGCQITVLPKPWKPNEPLAIQIIIQHPVWLGTLSITTPWNFPESETPEIKVRPLKNREYVPSEFAQNGAKDTTTWLRGESLVDIVVRLRAKGEL